MTRELLTLETFPEYKDLTGNLAAIVYLETINKVVGALETMIANGESIDLKQQLKNFCEEQKKFTHLAGYQVE